jgi:Domain of unknown function (DUF4157)
MAASFHPQTRRPTPAVPSKAGPLLQRRCACGGALGRTGECENCRKKREATAFQHESARESSSSLHGVEAPPIVDEVLQSPSQPLDENTRDRMEARLGHDFSGVRVHVDSRAAESARAVGASAYTVSQHIVFSEGKFAPSSSEGQSLLAHELAHVVQQAGRHHPPSGGILVGAENTPSEREAEQVAAGVAAPERRGDIPVRMSSSLHHRTLARQSDPQASKESEQKSDLRARRLAASPAQAILQWKTLSLNDQRLVLIHMIGRYGADFAAAFLPYARGERKPNISTSVETGTPADLVARGFRYAGDAGGVPTWVHPSGQEVKLLAKGRSVEERCINPCFESSEDEEECNACCENIEDASCRTSCEAACADKV